MSKRGPEDDGDLWKKAQKFIPPKDKMETVQIRSNECKEDKNSDSSDSSEIPPIHTDQKCLENINKIQRKFSLSKQEMIEVSRILKNTVERIKDAENLTKEVEDTLNRPNASEKEDDVNLQIIGNIKKETDTIKLKYAKTNEIFEDIFGATEKLQSLIERLQESLASSTRSSPLHHNGLINDQGTCLINAGIQLLSNVDTFVQFYSKKEFLKNNEKACPVSKELSSLIKELKGNTKMAIATKKFNQVYLNSEKHNTGPANNVVQFISNILELLSMECPKKKVENPSGIAAVAGRIKLLIEKTYIHDTFYNVIQDIHTHEECAYKSEEYLCNNLHLLPCPASDNWSVQECINQSIKKKKVTFFCKRCRRDVEGWKESTFLYLPDALFVAIKKVKDDKTWDKSKVEVSKQLTLFEDRQTKEYILGGASMHTGSVTDGHVFTVLCSQNNEYRSYSDEDVRDATFEDISPQDWILLLYLKNEE